MDRNELNKILCAILSTLSEVEYAPETSLYLGLGSDYQKWQGVKGLLIGAGLATCTSYQVRLTTAGKEMAAKVNKAAGL